MQIAILGTGSVGQALMRRFLAVGLTPSFGARNPAKAQAALVAELSEVAVGSLFAATQGADIVLLAVPAEAAHETIIAARIADGTIVVDCTNPLSWNDGPVWSPPKEGSMTAALAFAHPTLRHVKGFCHFGAEVMLNPVLKGGNADALFAGDDVGAKADVIALADRAGFRGRDAGKLRNAAALEQMAVLWIHLATAGKLGRKFGFITAQPA